MFQGQLKQAEKHCSELLLNLNDDFDAHRLMAHVQFAKFSLQEGLEHLEQAKQQVEIQKQRLVENNQRYKLSKGTRYLFGYSPKVNMEIGSNLKETESTEEGINMTINLCKSRLSVRELARKAIISVHSNGDNSTHVGTGLLPIYRGIANRALIAIADRDLKLAAIDRCLKYGCTTFFRPARTVGTMQLFIRQNINAH